MLMLYACPTAVKLKFELFPQLLFTKGHIAGASNELEYMLEQLYEVLFNYEHDVAFLQQLAVLVPHVEGSEPSAPGIQ